MQYFILITLLVYLFIYLFALFAFAHDNFVLLRKNITTERVFNTAFLVLLISLLFARIFFVAFHFSKAYFNPLVFFLFPYFPGLSVAGGLFVGIVFLLLYSNNKKLPIAYLFDIFSLAFFASLPVIMLIALALSKLIFISTPFLIIGIGADALLIMMFQKAKLRDGSLGSLSLIFSSIFLYAFHVVRAKFFQTDDIFLAVMILISLFYLFKEEKWMPKVKIKIKVPGKKKKHQRYRVLKF